MYLQESKIKSDLNSENITCFHTREDAYARCKTLIYNK